MASIVLAPPALAAFTAQSVTYVESWGLSAAVGALICGPAAATLYSREPEKTHFLSYAVSAVVSVMWALIGFSEVFSQPLQTGVVGMTDYATIQLITNSSMFTTVVFELAFALLAVNLVTGAVGHLFKPLYFIFYSLAFLVVTYCPQAMWFWNKNGWINFFGVVDVAGGAVVHLTAGVASLVLGLLASSSNDLPFHGEQLTSFLLVMVASLAQNAGKAAPIGSAGLSIVNTHLAAASGLICYNFLELLITKRGGLFPFKYTVQGSVKGAMIGLSTVASGCSVVGPMWTTLIALGATAVIYLVEALLVTVHLGAGKTVFLVHGLGGAAGMAMTGIFADTTYSSFFNTANAAYPAQYQTIPVAAGGSGLPSLVPGTGLPATPATPGVNGAFYRNAMLLGRQCGAVSVIILMTSVTTIVLYYTISAFAHYVFNTTIKVEEVPEEAIKA